MTKFQPRSVSNVSNPDGAYLVIPAIGQRPISKEECPDRVGRIFVLRVESARQLGQFQRPDLPNYEQPGTLYIELDNSQFELAKELLTGGEAHERVPQMQWTIEKDGRVSSLVIDQTAFHSRTTDIRELKTA